MFLCKLCPPPTTPGKDPGGPCALHTRSSLLPLLSSYTFDIFLLFRLYLYPYLLYAIPHLTFYYCYYYLVFIYLLILSLSLLPVLNFLFIHCFSCFSDMTRFERLPPDRLDPAVRRLDTERCRGTLLQTNCPALSATRTRLTCKTPVETTGGKLVTMNYT